MLLNALEVEVVIRIARIEMRWNLLGWCILLLNRAVDEDGDVVGGSVDSSLVGADAQLGQQVIKDLDGLGVLLLLDLGSHGIDGWHSVDEGGRVFREG